MVNKGKNTKNGGTVSIPNLEIAQRGEIHPVLFERVVGVIYEYWWGK